MMPLLSVDTFQPTHRLRSSSFPLCELRSVVWNWRQVLWTREMVIRSAGCTCGLEAQ